MPQLPITWNYECRQTGWGAPVGSPSRYRKVRSRIIRSSSVTLQRKPHPQDCYRIVDNYDESQRAVAAAMIAALVMWATGSGPPTVFRNLDPFATAISYGVTAISYRNSFLTAMIKLSQMMKNSS